MNIDLEEHKRMVIRIFDRLGKYQEDEAYEGSFPCPKLKNTPQVDKDYCESFVHGKGCKFMQDCPSFQLNCRMPEVKR